MINIQLKSTNSTLKTINPTKRRIPVNTTTYGSEKRPQHKKS
jgi:hypothetical protein